MPITPEVVTWARERLGYKQDVLAAKRSDFKRVAEWESGVSQPTYRQLELLAKDLWVPMAIFFFPEPPQLSPIQETFRTLGSEQFAEVPPRIRLLLHKAHAFQIGLAELNDERNPAAQRIIRELQIRKNVPVRETAARVREMLGVTLEEQLSWVDEDTALKAWRRSFYRAGVTVFKDAFREDDYCGFSLYDEEFSIIYVNNFHTKTRQIFTLFHELAHLLFHTSGLDITKEFRTPLDAHKQRIETICNQLAAAILVPEEAFDRELQAWGDPKTGAEYLAKKFSVSREVIYRKFLDRDLVTDADYKAAAIEWSAQRSSQKGGGGNFYRTKIRYLGEEYITLAFQRYYQDRIDEEQLADYLAIKPTQIDQLEDTLFEGPA